MKHLLPSMLFLFLFSFSAEAQKTSKDSLTAPKSPWSNNDRGALGDHTLYSFELLPFDSKNNRGKNSRKIQQTSERKTGSGIQRVTYYEGFGKNILDLYTEAYPGYTKDRFIYDTDLSYMDSREPQDLYSLKLKANDDIGDFDTVLLKQLNLAFGFKTSEIEQEASYYELTAIEPKEGVISEVDSTTTAFKNPMTAHSYKDFKVKMIGSAQDIADLVSDQLIFVQSEKYYNDPEKDKSYPVITHLEGGEYKLDLNIEHESKDLDEWIKLLNEKGLIIEKKKGNIPYIRIEKDL